MVSIKLFVCKVFNASKRLADQKSIPGPIPLQFFSRRSGGFTLIELLVVIAIIGLLSTLAIIALTNARLKSRDARRVSDIKQVQTALELYFNDCDRYPSSVTFGTGSIAGNDGYCSPSNSSVYMKIVPTNPSPRNDGSCPNVEYSYVQDSQASYHINYCLGGLTGGIPGGVTQHATPAGIR